MARPTYPSDSVDKLLLRFPEGMRDRIREEAERNGRSMNAEILVRLDQSFTTWPKITLPGRLREIPYRISERSRLDLEEELNGIIRDHLFKLLPNSENVIIELQEKYNDAFLYLDEKEKIKFDNKIKELIRNLSIEADAARDKNDID